LLLILELAEVHDFADRRFRGRRNLDKVETHGLGHANSVLGCHDALVFALMVDEANFGRADPVIDAGAGVPDGRSVMRSSGDGFQSSADNGIRAPAERLGAPRVVRILRLSSSSSAKRGDGSRQRRAVPEWGIPPPIATG
jgi:hypothetical protein